MSVYDNVLNILINNKNNAISGEEIAENLGVSRNSIWKSINKLREDGYVIEATQNRGYMLLSEADVLNESRVRKYLNSDIQVRIQVEKSVSSTNSVLKEQAEKGEPQGKVLIAEEQTAGRGRLGRKFLSPKRTGLYLSLLLRPKFSAENSLYITTAAAVSVANAINSVTGIDAKIKWVNDIYIDFKKVSGILTEASIDFESGFLNYAILGIGINIQEPEGGFPVELKPIATALYKNSCPEGTRAKISAEILNNFFKYYKKLLDKAYMNDYKTKSFLTGLEINFVQGNLQEQGRVIGIDDDARLIVELNTGKIKKYSAGEVNIIKNFNKKTVRGV